MLAQITHKRLYSIFRMLDLLYPYSYFGLAFGCLIGIGIGAVLFGFLSAGIILICISLGMIRIMPLVRLCNRFLNGVFPDKISNIKNNIRDSFKIKNPNDIPEGRHIYMWHPHGTFNLSNFFHNGTSYTNWPVLKTPIKPTAINFLSYMPFGLEFFEEFNAIPAEYFSMKKALENNSICLAPGGMREMLYKDSAILSKRRGIFKMALETGTPLIPIISKGEDYLYSIIEVPSFIQDFLGNYDICIGIPTYKSIVKMISLSTHPLKDPVVSIVGKAVPVERVEFPTDTQISELRKKYISVLKQLYKSEVGKELTII